jgi:ADP-ribosyltransferase exoenzyme
MISREQVWPRPVRIMAGMIAVLLIVFMISCGCLQVEPEELPPQPVTPLSVTTVFTTGPISTMENTSGTPPAVVIFRPKQTRPFTELQFPPDIEKAVSDFAGGNTTDTINGFLRWESVRARTDQPDAARIQEQIRRIDTALFNATAKEDIRVYLGVSGEQAKRIRNDTVYEEKGYVIASYDPSVVYHRLAGSGRDKDGYLTMCVIDERRGGYFLIVNATEREVLLPRGGIWDFAREDTYDKLEFSADSMPRYGNIVPTKVRLIYTKEHP